MSVIKILVTSHILKSNIFGVGQAVVSRSIAQIKEAVKECIPLPSKIHNKIQRINTLAELQEIIPDMRVLTDASEQQIQRPKRKDMEKSHYSDKAGTHTEKIQYITNQGGLLLHRTRPVLGKKHDLTVYKENRPIPTIKLADGTVCTIEINADRGYQGAPDVEDTVLLTPIKRKRCKKGEKPKKITLEEKEYNRNLSKIRIYVEHTICRVKKWKIMGYRYRNPLKNYDTINNIVCGLVNYVLQQRVTVTS